MTELEITKDEQLLKPADIARILNISKQMAYKLIQHGEIPVVHIGHAVRVKLKDLNEYVKRCYKG